MSTILESAGTIFDIFAHPIDNAEVILDASLMTAEDVALAPQRTVETVVDTAYGAAVEVKEEVQSDLKSINDAIVKDISQVIETTGNAINDVESGAANIIKSGGDAVTKVIKTGGEVVTSPMDWIQKNIFVVAIGGIFALTIIGYFLTKK